MCGRFAQFEPLSRIVQEFCIADIEVEGRESYNIAPGDMVRSVVSRDGRRVLTAFKWGLVPHWAKDPSIGHSLINARAESVHRKPSFRNAFALQRCLIIADGFYEWKKEDGGKRPYFLKLASGAPFAFAGLYDIWSGTRDRIERTCAIITTAANEVVLPIHDRMPVILSHDQERVWLDGTSTREALISLLAPSKLPMVSYSVSPKMNSPKINSPECIMPHLAGENIREPLKIK